MPYKHKQNGFTIVELLIVIVVIGILAAITIVAYNGIQARSKVAKKEAEINIIQKKLETYRVINNTYPLTGELAVTNTDLGSGITSNAVFTESIWNCDSPTSLTKAQYCVGSEDGRYVIYWWNDVAKTWHSARSDSGKTTIDTNVGTGNRPNGSPM